jgi:hypothetical protein
MSDPATIPAAKLAALTGLTDRRHRQLAAQGYFPAPHRGQYQAWPAIAGLFKYHREQLAKKDDELAVENKKLAKAKRRKAETELAILENGLVEKAEIRPALRNVAVQQRAVLQRKLEQELAPNLAGLKTVDICERMTNAVDEICGIFEEGIKEWVQAPPQSS